MIVGNRGFFPDHLAQRGREQMIGVLEKAGIEVVAVGPGDTKFGAVETREESRVCANLFKSRQDDIDGVIVTLPNFGGREGHCGCPALVRPGRACAGPGDTRQPGRHVA